ncbi:hypothetical protein EDB19DRAFT_1771972 [Suillus lakei]|nr:hypothetical protein EDB19DRAFT_1771972 [Suillus lakei]
MLSTFWCYSLCYISNHLHILSSLLLPYTLTDIGWFAFLTRLATSESSPLTLILVFAANFLIDCVRVRRC